MPLKMRTASIFHLKKAKSGNFTMETLPQTAYLSVRQSGLSGN
jgi:hypothetical protein